MKTLLQKKQKYESYETRKEIGGRKKQVFGSVKVDAALGGLVAFCIFLCFNLVINAGSVGLLGLRGERAAISLVSMLFGFHSGKASIHFAAMLLSLILGACVSIKTYLSYRPLDLGQKGSERWTSREEIAAQYKRVPERLESFEGEGGVPVARDAAGIFIDDSPVNNLILGVSRSGKGEMFVFPTIDIYSRAEHQASLIVTDPKLELAASAKPTLEERGYEVYILNLIEPAFSMKFNPLSAIIERYKAGEFDTAEELCATFCFSIFNNDASSGDNKFWADNSTALLTALILAACEDNLRQDDIDNERRKIEIEKENRRRRTEALFNLPENEREIYILKRHIKEQLEVDPTLSAADLAIAIYGDDDENSLAKIGEAMESDVKLSYDELIFVPTHENEKYINMFSIINTFVTLTNEKRKNDQTALDDYFNSRPEGNAARVKYATIGSAGGKTKGSIFSNTLSALQVFTYESIARMTSASSLDMLKVGFGEKPVAIFLAMPDYDASKNFLISVFVKQLYFALAKAATSRRNGKCERKVVFLLDEFGNIPPIEGMDSMITVCLGRNIHFNLVIQDYEQIHKLYGAADKTIKANCANHIYIMANSPETAKEYSALVGNRTYISVSRSGSTFSFDKNVTESIDSQPLIDENQLMNLKQGEMIVTRVIKRTDLKGNDIRSYAVPSFGKYRMKYRYQYLIEEFPSRALSDIEGLEDLRSISVKDISYPAGNFIKKMELNKKPVCDVMVGTENDRPIIVNGLFTDNEKRELLNIIDLPGAAAAKFVQDILPEMSLGDAANMALGLFYQGSARKAAAIYALIDRVYRRNGIVVSDLSAAGGRAEGAIAGLYDYEAEDDIYNLLADA